MSEALDRLERIAHDPIRATGREFKDPRRLQAICHIMWVRGQIGALARAVRIGEDTHREEGLTVEEVGLTNGVHFTGSYGRSPGEDFFAVFDATAAPGFPFPRLAACFQGWNLISFFVIHRDQSLPVSECFIDAGGVRLKRQWVAAKGGPRSIGIDSGNSGEEILRSGPLSTHQATILQRARERFARFLPMIDRSKGETLKNTFSQGYPIV